MKAFVKMAAATAVVTLMSTPAAFAAGQGPWNGAYVGGQLQFNTTGSDNVSSENAFGLGIFGGYLYQASQHISVGGEVFYNYNQAKDHSSPLGTLNFGSRVYGLNGIVGFPLGDTGAWMPYLKVGYGWISLHGNSGSGNSANSLRYGLGIALMLQPNLSLQAQYMYQKLGSSNDNFKDKNLSIGVSWHFQGQ